MMQYIDVSGKTEEEAIDKALAQLGRDRDEVSVEILERAKSGFLGIGATPATVRVSYDDGAPEPEEKPETFRPEQRKSKEERAREEAERKAEKERRRAAEAKKNAAKVEQPKDFAPEVLQNRDGGGKKGAASRYDRTQHPKPAERLVLVQSRRPPNVRQVQPHRLRRRRDEKQTEEYPFFRHRRSRHDRHSQWDRPRPVLPCPTRLSLARARRNR